jgi:hypothetical protein
MRGFNIMQTALIKNLKAGEYFKRKPDANKVYTRAEYCRDVKKYQCDDHSDIWGNGLQLKGNTLVYIGFTY